MESPCDISFMTAWASRTFALKISRPAILLIGFIALCVVFGLLTLRSNHVSVQSLHRHPVNFSDMPPAEQAKINESEGVMYKDDYVKRGHILESAKNGTISDTDLNWLIQMLKSPGPSQDVTVSSIRRANFFEALQEVKSYTPSQKEVVFQTMATFIMHSNRTDKLRSMGVFNQLKDTRALPYLTPLLNDTDVVVRRRAASAIKHISSQ